MTPAAPRGGHRFWGPDSMREAHEAAMSGTAYHAIPSRPEAPQAEFHAIPPPASPPPVTFHEVQNRPSLTTGRQLAVTPAQRETVLASATFRIWTLEGSADFAELAGITSEIEQTEYMEAGPVGALFSRHPGRSKPPTVTLRRALRTGLSTTWLWSWHQLARASLPGMHRDCSLTLFGPGDDVTGPGRMTYLLMNAFPSKVEIAGVKAGASEVVLQTVTLQCDDLLDPNAV